MSDLAHHTVRVATPDDRDGVIDLCRMCHKEVGIFSLSDSKMVAIVDFVLRGGDGVIGVIGDGKIEGSICLRLASPIYSDDVFLDEVWNFVHPEFRQPGRAKYLVRYAKQCADRLAVPLFSSSVVSSETEAKHRLYDRELSRSGHFYVYRPSSVSIAA
ncbi:MAG: hypothetical protein KGL39_04575 [Patescibacteria group bacterium]|nr:hypothetical protein [Patescibacteria group bacterium]